MFRILFLFNLYVYNYLPFAILAYFPYYFCFALEHALAQKLMDLFLS